MAEGLAIDEYRPGHVKELVRLWRESFEHGVGVKDPHPIEDQERYLVSSVAPNNAVRVAFMDGRMVGFIAATPESIAQLHVRVGFLRQGIGTRLLDWAKSQSSGCLWLFTFARNSGARAFYERHGFRIVARGHELEWDLDDLKYEWSRPA